MAWTEHSGPRCITHNLVFIAGVTPGTVIVIVGANATVADPATLDTHLNTLKPCLIEWATFCN